MDKNNSIQDKDINSKEMMEVKDNIEKLLHEYKEISPDLHKDALYEKLSIEFLIDNGLIIEFKCYVESKGYHWHDIM